MNKYKYMKIKIRHHDITNILRKYVKFLRIIKRDSVYYYLDSV